MFLLLSSLEIWKSHPDQSIEKFFLLTEKKNLQTSKVAAAEISFPSVYVIDTTCFNEGLSSHVVTKSHCFS